MIFNRFMAFIRNCVKLHKLQTLALHCGKKWKENRLRALTLKFLKRWNKINKETLKV